MKVILTKDIQGLGRIGDVKEVSDGHAKNYLFPKHLALPATSTALGKLQKEQKEQQEKIIRDQTKFNELKNKITNKTFIVSGKAEKNNLFAAVHEEQIARIINEKTNADIKPKQIKIPHAIKQLGVHEAEVKFSDNIYAKVKIEVKAAT